MKQNIAFFGTSDRSIPILETLYQNHNLSLCVTKSDVKVGRHQTLKETGVKHWAIQKRVHLLTIDSINAETTRIIIEQILGSNTTIGVVADFSFILPLSVIDTPKHKIINIHFSLLPKYRGASPVQHAILNSDTKTGITYYVMDKGMDTGPIIHQIEYNLKMNETSGELYRALFEIAAKNLPKVIDEYISAAITPTAQNNASATYSYSKTHPKSTFIFKDDARIDWTQNGAQIERTVRAFDPWPVAWTTLAELGGALSLNLKESADKNMAVKIHKARLADGALVIDELQPAGKRRMSWKDFSNGYFRAD